MSKKMWMVRAGEGGFLIDKFKDKSAVAIGWKIGDLSNVETPSSIKTKIKERFPEKSKGYVSIVSSQISKFRFDIKIGDIVISYNTDERVYLVGEISSDYIYEPNFCEEKPGEYGDVRKVEWKGEVNRDDLSTSTKNTLGAISTLFEINNEASKEILNLLKGKKVSEAVEEDSEESDLLKDDVISRSQEFIQDKVVKLDWDEMQELVAGLLRGMGYKTIVSAKGPDRGRDIIASPDGLGLEEPRIVVEVKHRNGSMGSREIRSFSGGLREGDKGLYVSTGGFSKEARYEADRSNIPLTLVDLDLLVKLILQYYDNFDSEARTLIPLTKIYWPV